ncbi:MAG: flagellar assembly protein FliW [Pirellulaceae bacterium]|nr:flagellar assembly protein FliW [Pirellulaceae bacterium]
MNLQTAHFGHLALDASDVLTFPDGLIGMEHLRSWVLLADSTDANIAWLQSFDAADIALPVVSPTQFVPNYRVCTAPEELELLGLEELGKACVLIAVAQSSQRLTINLKAPLILNLERRIGRQVITLDDRPVQLEIASRSMPLRKSA